MRWKFRRPNQSPKSCPFLFAPHFVVNCCQMIANSQALGEEPAAFRIRVASDGTNGDSQ